MNSQGLGNRFFKVFPDEHLTVFPGASGDILGYCSARGAAYLIDSLRVIGSLTVSAVSDTEVASTWQGTFINLGSSASNIKTNDVKHLSSNHWLADDLGQFIFKNGQIIQIEEGSDKGIIFKLDNPYDHGFSLIVCAGLGEWGTSGAAWFLSKHWRAISNRFGKNPFLIVVSVTFRSDESAKEILAFGKERSICHILHKLGFIK
jgi:hypothetical protein